MCHVQVHLDFSIQYAYGTAVNTAYRSLLIHDILTFKKNCNCCKYLRRKKNLK